MRLAFHRECWYTSFHDDRCAEAVFMGKDDRCRGGSSRASMPSNGRADGIGHRPRHHRRECGRGLGTHTWTRKRCATPKMSICSFADTISCTSLICRDRSILFINRSRPRSVPRWSRRFRRSATTSFFANGKLRNDDFARSPDVTESRAWAGFSRADLCYSCTMKLTSFA